MKKLALLVLALALYQNWGKIHNWMAPAPPKHQEVVLYATSWCGYCAKTRELFAEQGIVYREENIEHSSAARAAYQSLGGRGVPVIDVRGTVIHGYDPQAIMAAY